MTDPDTILVKSEWGAEWRQPVDFDCVICGRHYEGRFPGGRPTWSIAPICYNCEKCWGRATGAFGAFKDRRIASQIFAVASVLECAAQHEINKWIFKE